MNVRCDIFNCSLLTKNRMHVLLIALFFTATVAVNPGIKLLVTQKGINYANSIAVGIINKEIKSITLPNQYGKAHHVHYKLENLVLSSFNLPNSNLVLESGSGLKWTATNIAMEIKGRFSYKFRKHFIKISDHGSINVKVRGISIGLDMQLGVDRNEKPSITPNRCTCSISNVDIRFHGGRAFIYNLFRKKVGKSVQGQLQTQMCTLVKSLVRKKAEQFLSKLNVQFPLTKFLNVDYGLVSAPSVSAKDLQINVKGQAIWKGDRTPVPFGPPAMHTSVDESKMLTVVISDYIFNTIAYRVYEHGMFARNVTSKDFPSGDMLNTTCTGMCIGRLIPQIGQAFPNSNVEVEVEAEQRPIVSILNNAFFVHGTTVIKLFARQPDESIHYLFSIIAEGSLTFLPTLTQLKMKGTVGSMTVKINVTDSAIGNINSEDLQCLANIGISTMIKPMMNEYGARGIPLTSVDGFRFHQLKMKLLENAIVISTNAQMTPTANNYSSALKFDPMRMFRNFGNSASHDIKSLLI